MIVFKIINKDYLGLGKIKKIYLRHISHKSNYNLTNQKLCKYVFSNAKSNLSVHILKLKSEKIKVIGYLSNNRGIDDL